MLIQMESDWHNSITPAPRTPSISSLPRSLAFFCKPQTEGIQNMQQILPFIWNFLFCFNMSSKQIAKAIKNNKQQQQEQFKNSNFQMKIDCVAH